MNRHHHHKVLEQLGNQVELSYLDLKSDPLYRHIEADQDIYTHLIRTYTDYQEAKRHLLEQMQVLLIYDLHDVKMVFEETLSNAMYHAFNLANGTPKYPYGSKDMTLAPQEIIRFQYAHDAIDQRLTISVFDNGQQLTLLKLLTILGKTFSPPDPSETGSPDWDALFLGGKGFKVVQAYSFQTFIYLREKEHYQIIITLHKGSQMHGTEPIRIRVVT